MNVTRTALDGDAAAPIETSTAPLAGTKTFRSDSAAPDPPPDVLAFKVRRFPSTLMVGRVLSSFIGFVLIFRADFLIDFNSHGGLVPTGESVMSPRSTRCEGSIFRKSLLYGLIVGVGAAEHARDMKRPSPANSDSAREQLSRAPAERPSDQKTNRAQQGLSCGADARAAPPRLFRCGYSTSLMIPIAMSSTGQ